ncbi:undecaprenyl-diphosphate phosphatase [Aneurinibacillus sp. Ricciae_BoGa-3]|uniref:undecaprenyl-diphosphate phosphatase n=1 Tax=Aneurinibacillus sp. Ricciae_BoGa-3 TaxID=3022697 RepID=UPI002340766F|nr:undecaprenyl-diphosphate phosphatase [Aneurinibacillus sp. Ricciae_BoGa-3]WCK54055.1 undecaprenyl-diphosphate phosphatase [Aneurinibacillus sp. Ricciae_BoGa-3]
MSFIQTVIIAIIQGITELFPVSSVAHGVLTPYVFRWDLDPQFLKEHFLAYVVMLHLGTAVALLLFFWKEWVAIIRSFFDGSMRNSRKVFLLIVVGTIPAAILGLLLEKRLTLLFSSVTSAAIFLILNGFLLFFGEKASSRGKLELEDLSYKQAVVIGFFQSLALVPGFSRSGASMTAGFWMGLKHEAAARFSMLLATPIILGASVKELPKLYKSHVPGLFANSLLGGVLSGVFALISVWILMRWFKKREINAMRPFAYYCWGLGIIILLTKFI